MDGEITEVYALRYAARPGLTASEAFHMYGLYGESDVAVGMDYFFWLIRSRTRTIVVDCGYSETTALKRDRRVDTAPRELLARMGVDPAAVDDVVLTHMHFDHVGNTDLFPNAAFHMARAEFAYWTGRHRDRPAFSWPVEPAEVRAVEALEREGRLHLLGDSAEVAPGVRATRFPGHTPGQLVTEVAVGGKRIVLASDAIHLYDEIRRDRPFFIFTDIAAMFDSYQALRELDARADTEVIAGHDPAVAAGYAEVAENCFDLTRPWDGASALSERATALRTPDDTSASL